MMCGSGILPRFARFGYDSRLPRPPEELSTA